MVSLEDAAFGEWKDVIVVEWSAYLWCVLRTQGNAEVMERPMMTFVTTAMAMMASWMFEWLINNITTRNTNQMNPEMAHPEWIPPRC